MKTEKQVTNLEISKKLKELGVKQDSLWYHCEDNYNRQDGKNTITILFSKDIAKARKHNAPKLEIYSAFTVAELGEIISKDYFSKKFGKDWICESEIGGGGDEYGEAEKSIYFQTKADTEADCRGKMLIYLIENKV